MASGYALPGAASAGSNHVQSHSFSGIHLSPDHQATRSFASANGTPIRKKASSNPLFTHEETSRETSRETSPNPSPHAELPAFRFPAIDQNVQALQHDHVAHQHSQTRSWSPMKSRPRGDSDLGDTSYRANPTTSTAKSTGLGAWLSLPEALTSLLVPTPYILAATAYSSMSGRAALDFPPLAIYEPASSSASSHHSSGLVATGCIVSGVLLGVGAVAKLSGGGISLDRRKTNHERSAKYSLGVMQSVLLRAIALALPIFAATQLGGTRVGLIMLTATALGLEGRFTPYLPCLQALQELWSSKVASSAVLVLSFITDEAGLTIHNSLSGIMLGYLALGLAVLALPPPLPTSPYQAAIQTSSHERPMLSRCFLVQTPEDINYTLIAGAVSACVTTLAAASLYGAELAWASWSFVGIASITVIALVICLFFSTPNSLRSESKAGLALGCLTTASCSFLFSPSLWPGTVCNGGLSALAFLSVLYDADTEQHSGHYHDSHDHTHEHTHHHGHTHHQPRVESTNSALTKFIMARCEPGSLVSSILSEKDSRRIAYFTILNFAFMLVQGAYGYMSGSLGLLSDTVHMFFDCLGLIVGLGAAVASKWPTSPEKPYGWGKLNTLAGFGNGVFLMLVSVEFVWEAIEGILDKRELRHVQELLVVSTLGLLVNMVGLFAFGHAHAGHDHGHSHSHSGSHSQNHDHAHEHGHSHVNAHSHDCDHGAPRAAGDHGHHHNDNMHGIFLHVAADAGGSLAVIISTALTLWKPWYLWDPLATIIIAILIFAAAVPLVISSGQKLLLVIPEDLEYSIKNTLQGLGELRGVVGYSAPRFWLDDTDSQKDPHGHEGHGHGASTGHAPSQRIQGVIHIIAAPSADLQDVRERVEEYTLERHMDLVIHCETEGQECWCQLG